MTTRHPARPGSRLFVAQLLLQLPHPRDLLSPETDEALSEGLESSLHVGGCQLTGPVAATAAFRKSFVLLAPSAFRGTSYPLDSLREWGPCESDLGGYNERLKRMAQ